MKRKLTFEAWIEEEDAERFLASCHRDGLKPGEVVAELVEGLRPGGLGYAAEVAKDFYSILATAKALESRPTFGQWLDRCGRLEDADRLAVKAEDILEEIDVLLDDGVPADDMEIIELKARERNVLEPMAKLYELYRLETGASEDFKAALAERAEYSLWLDVVRMELKQKEGREDG